MIIYLVRHGETIWNKKKILQGHKDSSLTSKGERSADKLGRILSKKDIKIIYTSDLGRCLQSAKIINKRLKAKLVKTPKLRERNFGSLNGKPEEEVRKVLDLSDPNKAAPRGESFNQLKNRIIDFIKLLGKKKLGKILLVTHEGAARAILSECHKVNFTSKKCDTRADSVYKIEAIDNKIKKMK